jgi:hypothetical protein
VNVLFACGNSMAGESLLAGIPLDLIVGLAVAIGGSVLLVGAAFVAAFIGGLVIWVRS